MPEWTAAYVAELRQTFVGLTKEPQVNAGYVAPALDDLAIGNARRVRATVLFFDIEKFTDRAASGEDADLTRALTILNCTIPMMMRVIYGHGGYIEKNTGDGLMAIFTGANEATTVGTALDAAVTCFFAMREIVNPYLVSKGIATVNARIGIDHGQLLLAKIGVPTGSAAHQRNFVTAVGPSANIAFRLQELAGRNEIYVGDLVRQNASAQRQFGSFLVVAPPGDWPWVYRGTTNAYYIWRLNEHRTEPLSFTALLAALGGAPRRV